MSAAVRMCTVCGRKPVCGRGRTASPLSLGQSTFFFPPSTLFVLRFCQGFGGGSQGGLLFSLGVTGLQLELSYLSPALLDRPEILGGRVFRQLGSSPTSAPLFISLFIYLGQPFPAPAVFLAGAGFPSSLCEFPGDGYLLPLSLLFSLLVSFR